jgi:hypothetical protein
MFKKVICIVIVIIVSVSLFACSEQGTQGERGEQGFGGLSAYEIYKKYYPDYQGTEEEWVNEVLKGEKGGNGDKGDNGLSAYEIYKRYYLYEGTEGDWIEDLINGSLEPIRIREIQKLSVALEATIKQDWVYRYSTHISLDKYPPTDLYNCFGLFGGDCVVFVRRISDYNDYPLDTIFENVPFKINVAGYSFSFVSSAGDPPAQVWKDGSFYTWNEAYNKGYLTKADFAWIYFYYTNDFESSDETEFRELQELSPELEARVKNDWYERFGFQWPTPSYPKQEAPVSYFGTYNCLGVFGDDCVVFIGRNSMFEGSYTVAGYKFSFANVSDSPMLGIRAWKDGQFYTWYQAYDMGFLTRTDVALMYLYCYGRSRS